MILVSYLSPKIEIIVDDIIELEDKKKLIEFLNNWLEDKIKETLKNLFDLKLINEKNPNIRALAYQLYENNQGFIIGALLGLVQ